jgi:hypothetical protein
MSKPITYFPPRDVPNLTIAFAHRTTANNILTKALADHCLGDVQPIILAYSNYPLDNRRFDAVCASVGPVVAAQVLDQELLYTTTLTSKFAQTYLERYKWINPETSLAEVGAKARNLQCLYIGSAHIGNLAQYLEYFPRVQTLILEGQFPKGAAIASKHLETLDLFGVENSDVAVAHVQPSCTSLRRCVRYDGSTFGAGVLWEPLRPIVNLIATNALRCLPKPLKEQAETAIAERSGHWHWATFESNEAFEWELGKKTNYRYVLDATDLSSIPDCLFPPLSTVRNLILDRYLPTFADPKHNATFRMLVSDYLTDCTYENSDLAWAFRKSIYYSLPLAEVETTAAQYVRVCSSERGLSNEQLASINSTAASFIEQVQKEINAKAERVAKAQIEVLD